MAKSLIRVRRTGNFKSSEKKINNSRFLFWRINGILDSYGKRIVDALRVATPRDTGLTAESWSYAVKNNQGGIGLLIYNSNTAKQHYVLKRGYGNYTSASSKQIRKTDWSGNKGDSRYYDVPIVIFLHYGHGTRNGGYVPPNPFITNTVDPIFDEMKRDLALNKLLGTGGGWSKSYGN